jgi:hypothetical protein
VVGGRALLAAGSVAPSSAAPAGVACPSPACPRFSPRITLIRRDRPREGRTVFSPCSARPAPDGWQKAESRGSRRRRLRAARPPRRAVPADLVGKCFNCLSPSHTAALCRSQTRCFRCKFLGHHSSVCPRAAFGVSPAARSAAARVSVWRRISPAVAVSSSAHPRRSSPADMGRRFPPSVPVSSAAPPRRSSPADVAGSAGAAQGDAGLSAMDRGGMVGRSRRRRRPRFRRGHGDGQSDPAMVVVQQPGPAQVPVRGDVPPPCIIDWSDQLASGEEDLANAIMVSVISDVPLVSAGEVAAVIAAMIDVAASSLVLRRASPSSFLLVLPDLVLVERLIGIQQPVRSLGGGLSLLCKRWNRLAGALGRVLPSLIDVELRGIPAHVWETSTADRLLCPYAWIQQVHPDTLGLLDLSSFRCLAWCSDLSKLPSSRELWVVEPPSGIVEVPPVKRVLSYPVEFRFSEVRAPAAPDPPASDGRDEDDGGDSSRGRRRRLRSPSRPRQSDPLAVTTSGVGGSLRELGPCRAGSSSLPACSELLSAGVEAGVAGFGASPVPVMVQCGPVLVDAPAGSSFRSVGVEEGALACPDVSAPDVLAAAACVAPIALFGGGTSVPMQHPVGLDMFSGLGQGEATDGCSPGLLTGLCPPAGLPVGLATDGPLLPASPCSPRPGSAELPSSLPPTPAAVGACPPGLGEPALPASVSPLARLAGASSSPMLAVVEAPALLEPVSPHALPARSDLPEPVLLPSRPAVVSTTPALRVYSRRRCRPGAPPPPAPDGAGAAPGADSPLLVLDRVCKPVDALLPQPVIRRSRRKAPLPRSLPRRSRRVAGAAPCSPGPVLSAAQKRVMRHLGFDEKEIFSPSAQDKFCKLFKPSPSGSHVCAMAAIFGWEFGDGEQVRPAEVLTTL